MLYGKGWVLLAGIELPASKTRVVAARVDPFLKYAAAIGL